MAAPGRPNYKAVTDDDEIEWLQSPPGGTGAAMARRLAVAEELGQPHITRYLHKLIRAHAAEHGRVRMVFDIARQEETVQVASELLAPRRGA